MATTHLTQSTFEKSIDRDGIVLVDWWAPWCPPCRAFGPVFERVSGRHEEILFAKVNTEEEGELAAAFEIQSIPTVMLFRDKVLLFAESGAMPEAALEQLIEKAKGLDMAAVKAEMASRDEAPGEP